MSLTRQHFQAIAEAINHMELKDEQDRYIVARDIADQFRRFNSGFDRKRFYEACGVGA